MFLEPPEIFLQSSFLTVWKNESLNVVCNATGTPLPNVTWIDGSNAGTTMPGQNELKFQKYQTGNHTATCVAESYTKVSSCESNDCLRCTKVGDYMKCYKNVTQKITVEVKGKANI